MYFNIANRTVRPMLEYLYGDVSSYTEMVQQEIYEATGVGLQAISPLFNEERAKNLVTSIATDLPEAPYKNE